MSISADFSSPYVPRFSCSVSVPFWVFVMRSLQELSIMPSTEGDFSHVHPLPAARPGLPVSSVVEGWYSGDSHYYSIQWVESKDWATWELIWGLGILVHPFPPVQAYLWATSFIERIFSSLHTESAWPKFMRVVRPKSWRLEGVRIWKLSRTYPGENHLHSQYSRTDVVWSRASPHGTCWLCPTSL